APVAAHLAAALERARERRGVAGHVLVEGLELGDRAQQRRALLGLLAVEGVDAAAEFAQALVEGLEQGLDVGAALAVGRAHAGLELLAALIEHLARQRREVRRQPRARLVDEGLHLGARALGVLEVGGELRAAALGVGALLPQFAAVGFGG